MPKQKAIALIGELHQKFGDDQVSEGQKNLLLSLEQHIHTLGEAEAPEPDFVDTLDTLVTEAELDHPAMAAVMRNLLETLKNIGI
jgi:uncharacterized coiled-coil protein SlyX